MEAVIIKREELDRAFDETLEKLELKLFQATPDHAIDRAVGTPLGDLHRKFHYEICLLKQRLIKS